MSSSRRFKKIVLPSVPTEDDEDVLSEVLTISGDALFQGGGTVADHQTIYNTHTNTHTHNSRPSESPEGKTASSTYKSGSTSNRPRKGGTHSYLSESPQGHMSEFNSVLSGVLDLVGNLDNNSAPQQAPAPAPAKPLVTPASKGLPSKKSRNNKSSKIIDDFPTKTRISNSGAHEEKKEAKRQHKTSSRAELETNKALTTEQMIQKRMDESRKAQSAFENHDRHRKERNSSERSVTFQLHTGVDPHEDEDDEGDYNNGGNTVPFPLSRPSALRSALKNQKKTEESEIGKLTRQMNNLLEEKERELQNLKKQKKLQEEKDRELQELKRQQQEKDRELEELKTQQQEQLEKEKEIEELRKQQKIQQLEREQELEELKKHQEREKEREIENLKKQQQQERERELEELKKQQQLERERELEEIRKQQEQERKLEIEELKKQKESQVEAEVKSDEDEANMKETLEEYNNEIESLRNQVDCLKQELKESQSSEQKTRDNAKQIESLLKNQIDDLTTELDKSQMTEQATKDNASEVESSLRKQLEEMTNIYNESQIAEQRTKDNAAEIEVFLKKQVEELRNEIEAIHTAKQQAIDEESEVTQSLRRQIEDIEQQLSDSQIAVEQLATEKMNLQADCDNTVDAMREEVRAMEEQVSVKIALVNQENMKRKGDLKRTLRARSAIIHIFEDAVESQNEVMNNLCAELERLQDTIGPHILNTYDPSPHNSDAEDEEEVDKDNSNEVEDNVRDSSPVSPVTPSIKDPESNQKITPQSTGSPSGVVLRGWSNDSGGEAMPEEFIPRDITPKELPSSPDVKILDLSDDVKDDAGLMRGWGNQNKEDKKKVQKASLAIASNILIALSKANREEAALRSELQAELNKKQISMEALGEAAIAANEAIRDMSIEMKKRSKWLETEKAKTARLEGLLKDRDMVLVTVSKAIADQENIMNNLQNQLLKVEQNAEFENDAFFDDGRSSPPSRVQSPTSSLAIPNGKCLKCEENKTHFEEIKSQLENMIIMKEQLESRVESLETSKISLEEEKEAIVNESEKDIATFKATISKLQAHIHLVKSNSQEIVSTLKGQQPDMQEGSNTFLGFEETLRKLEEKEQLLAEEIEDRIFDRDNTKALLDRTQQIHDQVKASLKVLENIEGDDISADSPSRSSVSSKKYRTEDGIVVVDTEVALAIQEQVSTLCILEEELKAKLLSFESDAHVANKNYLSNSGDRRAISKLREEVAVFLGQSKASLHELEDKVADYMGSLGEERYSRMKELESLLQDKEKMIQLLEKQNTFQESTLSNMRAELEKMRSPRKSSGLGGLATRFRKR